MSWTDEEIDNLFKDGANAQSFKYDSSYFAEMEAASLPVNKKGKDFLWMGTALVFIAVLTTGYFVNDTNTSFNTANNQLANLELNNTNDNTNNTNALNGNQNSTGDQNTLTNNTSSDDVNNQLTNLDASNDKSNSNSGVLSNGNSGNANLTNNQSAKSPNTNSPNSMYNLATRNVGSLNVRTNNQSALAGANGSQETGQLTSHGNLSGLRNDAKVNDQKQFTLQAGPITAGLDVNDAVQIDQGLNPSLSPNALPPLGELRPKAALYFELNAGISQSLITPSEYTSKSVGGGIGVESYLGNFNLTTGLNFKASYHDDLFLTRKGKVYGFGSTAGKNTYDVQKIYSLEMPITLGYNFGKHNINIGVRPSVVVGAQTKFQAFEEDQLLRTSQINGLIEEEINGETTRALMRFGLKPTFGYSYHMNKWTVGVNVGLQLMESVDESMIDGFNNKFPVDGQIYLRRTIRLRK